MEESKLLGTLLPSSPDFLPIVRAIREKYQLPEISPGDDPITEIFLNGEPVTLEGFRQEIKALVGNSADNLPSEASKIIMRAKAFVEKPLDMHELESCPEKMKQALIQFCKVAQGIGRFVVRIIDQFHSAIVDMLYIYLLTKESQEVHRGIASPPSAARNDTNSLFCQTTLLKP